VENLFRNIFLIDSAAKKAENLFIKRQNKKQKMNFNKESAIERAKADLAERLKVSANEIEEVSVSECDFPDMSLGAPVTDEMSAQMISTGWQINLAAGSEKYEYRADKYQLRLCGFRGTNYIVES